MHLVSYRCIFQGYSFVQNDIICLKPDLIYLQIKFSVTTNGSGSMHQYDLQKQVIFL